MNKLILSLLLITLILPTVFSAEKNNFDYIVGAKDSSIDMLIKATKMLEDGKISKDKYIEVAKEVSKMAEYSKKTVAAAPKKITDEQLKKLNEERVQNKLKPIDDVDLVEETIQNELDHRVEINLQNRKDKKPPLPAMPIMEKLGALNSDRESKRQNSIKNSQSADSMANEVTGRKSGILEIYKSYNKKIDDKKLDELTKSEKTLSEIIKEMNQN
jgi:hypothetical protein